LHFLKFIFSKSHILKSLFLNYIFKQTEEKKEKQQVQCIRALVADTLYMVHFPKYKENVEKESQKITCNRFPTGSLSIGNSIVLLMHWEAP
jgi:hypothetical protein